MLNISVFVASGVCLCVRVCVCLGVGVRTLCSVSPVEPCPRGCSPVLGP